MAPPKPPPIDWGSIAKGGKAKPVGTRVVPGGAAKAAERAQSKEAQSVGYSEKSLVRLLGRLVSTPKLSSEQQDQLGALLTGYKPKKVKAMADEAELPQPVALELVDLARKAQGLEPLAKLARTEERLTNLSEKAARSLEQRGYWGETPGGASRAERAMDLAADLPEAYVKRATEALRAKGLDVPGMSEKDEKYQRESIVKQAGSDLTNRGLGEAFAGALDPTKTILGSALDLTGRPGQAVLGGVAEGPEGVWRGLSGKEQYTPIQSVLRATGSSEKEAAEAEGDLPGLVRFPVNMAGYVATDPLTYLSFGTSAASKQAVRAVAPKIAEAGGRSVDDVVEGLLTSGVKSLDDVERAALPTSQGALAKLVGKAPSTGKIEKLLDGAPGGVKFRGRSIPGTRLPSGPSIPAREILNTPESLFRPRAGVQQAARRGEGWAKDLAPKLENMLARLEGSKDLADKTLLKKIENVVRGNKVGSADDLAAIRRSLDVGGADVVLTGPQRAVRDELRGLLDEMLDAERAVGIETATLGKKALTEAGDDYLPHVAIKQPWWKRLGADKGERSPLTEPPGGYMKGREHAGSIDEIHAEQGRDLFETDPLKAVMSRGLQSNRDVTNAKFVDDLMGLTDDAGEPLVRPLPEAYQDIKQLREAGMVDVEIPGVGQVMVHEALEHDVKRIAAVVGNDKAMKSVMKAYDKYLALWKGYATVPFPFSGGFSFRNMFGNWWSSAWLPDSGVRATPVEFGAAAKWQSTMAKGWKEAGDPFAYIDDVDDAAKLRGAFETGVLGEGFYTVDLDDLVSKVAKPRLRDVGPKEVLKRVGKASNPLSPDFKPVQIGRSFNSAIENNARLALYLRNVDTLGQDGAAALVRKYLFDYSDLTPFERDAMRRVVPFYTWTRKNLPLQIEALLKQPGRFSRVEQVRWGINQEAEDQETGPIPAWMLEQQGVIVPGGISDALAGIPGSGFSKNTTAMFMPDMPYLNIEDQIGPLANLAAMLPGFDKVLPKGEGAGRAISQLAGNVGGPLGVLKSLAEVGLGSEFFTGRRYYPGEKVEAPFYLAPFAGDAEVNAGEGQEPAVSPQVVNVLESAFPVLSKMRTLAPTSKRDEDASARRRLSMFTGLNVWPLGEATQRSELLRRIATADAIRVALENAGVEVPDSDAIPGKRPKAPNGPVAKPIDWKSLVPK